MFTLLLGTSTISAGIRLATPILLAALGGALTFHANILNVAMEGFMLISAFFAVVGSYYTGSPWIGLLLAILSGALFSLLFGYLSINLKANHIVVGWAINVASWGTVAVLLQSFFGVRGAFFSEKIINFKNLEIPFIKSIPWVGGVISGYNIFTYTALILVVIFYIYLYYTKYGLRLRVTGEKIEAAQTAGVNVLSYFYFSVLMSGIMCGIAGASLSLSGLSMFTEEMSAGKGWIALAVVFFASGKPPLVLLASLLFGYADSLGIRLEAFNIPSQIIYMVPYILTLLMLLSMAKKQKIIT